MDACDSAGTGTNVLAQSPGQGTMEIIAACGIWDTTVTGKLDFTRALILQFCKFASNLTRDFSVAALHATLLSGHAARIASMSQRGEYVSERATPVYIALGDTGRRPSISLQVYGSLSNGRLHYNTKKAEKAAAELWLKYSDLLDHWPAPANPEAIFWDDIDVGA